MKDRTEKFSILPFSVGCVSQSSVDVIENPSKKSQPEPNPSPPSGEEEAQSSGKMKNPAGLIPLPRANISAGLQRLIKSFKNLSQLFVVYRGEDGEEEEEMVIGFPTDVQHVGHIGWDGPNSSGISAMASWDGGPELLSLNPLSLRQFHELAMAREADADASHG